MPGFARIINTVPGRGVVGSPDAVSHGDTDTAMLCYEAQVFSEDLGHLGKGLCIASLVMIGPTERQLPMPYCVWNYYSLIGYG